ncbi:MULTISPECIES: MarR family winged helix-turn-helix transcriptional regulator [unclassified Microbacterium]|uniref:MarR family winged helix-turn-helix transcriptional regulator n=1 Tax=unclassified Microbacterium TaxID=2609290 RepID=UPI0037477E82
MTDPVGDVLKAVRALSDSLDRMHGGMKDAMDMNASDLAALRMLIVREHRGESVSPHDLARHLRISTASTTKLLDRLEASGHIERGPHPHDRRARVVTLTDASRHEFIQYFGEHLGTMRDVAESYSAADLVTITRFLDDLGEALDPR